MGALSSSPSPSPKDEDKMPEDREGRREWLKRRQQKRLSSDIGIRAESPSLNIDSSPSSDSETHQPQTHTSPGSTRLRIAADIQTKSSSSSSSHYRLSNPSLPTEFILALDAEKSEANRLRQQLAAKEAELAKTRLEKNSEIKRMSLLSITSNNQALNELEVSNEDLKAKVSQMEFTTEQMRMELESAKTSLENEVKYRALERDQARSQMASLTAERDNALKEAVGKSAVLGSTELIVNQTTKELTTLKARERELSAKLQDREVQLRNQMQALMESDDKLKRALGEVQNRSMLVRTTEERLRNVIQEMGNARAREADLVRRLEESDARLQDSSSAFEEFKKVSTENLYQAKQVEESLRIETRDLQNQLNQVIHGSRIRDDEIKKNRELIQGMASRIGAMDRDIGNAKTLIGERDQKIAQLTRDFTALSQKEVDLLQQIDILNQSHGGEMAAALTSTQNHQMELEKLRNINNDVSEKLDAARTSITELESTKKTLEETVASLKNRVSSLDNELGVSQTLADETVIKIRQLNDEITHAAAKERKLLDDQQQMQTRFGELDSIAQRLVADRDGWRNRSSELERLLDQSRKESGELSILKDNTERDLRKEISEQQKFISDVTAENNRAVAAMRAEISTLENNAAVMKQNTDELEVVVRQLRGELDGAHQNEKYLEEQIMILKEARGGDMAAALERTEKNQKELQSVINDRTALQGRISEMDAVIKHLVSDRDSYMIRAEELQASLDKTVTNSGEAYATLRKTLEDQITQANNQLQALSAEKKNLDDRNFDRIHTLEGLLQSSNTTRSALEATVAALKKDLFDAINVDQDDVVQEMQMKLHESASIQSSLNNKISDLLATIKAQEKEKADLQANVTELEETIDELMLEQKAEEKKMAKLQASLKKAKQEIVDVERTTDASITHLRDESTFAVKRLQDDFNRTLWNVRVELNSLMSAVLQTDKTDDMDDSSNLSTDVDELFADLKLCRQKALEWIVTINVASTESETAAQNLSVLKAQLSSLQKQLAAAKRDVDMYMLKAEETTDLESRQRQQIKILEQQLEKAKKLKEEAEKKAISSSTDNEEIILALQQEMISIRGQLAKKTELLKRTSPSEMQELLKSGEAELTEARTATAIAEKDLRAAQRTIQEYEGTVEKLQTEITALETQLADANSQAQKDKESSNTLVESLKSELSSERASLAEAQEAVLTCQNMIRDLESLRNEMVLKFEKQLDEKEESYAKALAELESVHAEADDLKYDLDDMDAKLQAATANNESLETNYELVKGEVDLLRNHRRESLEAMQSMIQSLQLRLQEEQDSLETTQAKWNEEQSQHLKKIAQLETDIQEKDIALQKLSSNSSNSSDEVHTLRAEIAALQVQLEDKESVFMNALVKATGELEGSQTEITRLTEELEKVVSVHATQTAEYEAELQTLKASVASLEAQVKTAQEALVSAASNGSGDTIKELLESSAAEVAKLKAELQETSRAIEVQKGLADNEVNSLKAIVSELKEQLKEAQESLSASSSPAPDSATSATVTAVAGATAEEIEKLKLELSVAETEVTRLKQSLVDSDNALKETREKLESHEHSLVVEKYEAEQIALKESLAKALAECDQLKVELSLANAKRNSRNSSVDEAPVSPKLEGGKTPSPSIESKDDFASMPPSPATRKSITGRLLNVFGGSSSSG
ncbi:hypothetical protein HK100_011451 [Physocladia obscura]|uniref:Uncharacterized protein n=1 Tax=Physocladia obscura TaxID=109957 RepID=A0AAD5T463_9FUNG|nr:hypothetical protein HK100_011451 [Physocladia obscura]